MGLIKERKQIAKMDLEENILEVYESISDASRKNNISLSSLSQVCSGKRKTCAGYK